MIKLANIYKWYKIRGVPSFILNDINLEIEEGDFISVMGPSGSGKSTLLNVIGMLDEPNEGAYYFMEENVFALKPKKRMALYQSFMGYVFQAYHLIDELTVYENIETPLIYKKISGK